MACLKEDQELMNRLRTKYSSHSTDVINPQDALQETGLQSSTGPGSLVHVHLCPICQGSGMKEEVYEFRRLQSTCSHCQGEGILSGNTAAGPTTSNSSKPDSTADCRKAAAEQHASEPSDTAATDTGVQVHSGDADSTRHSQRQLSRLQQMLAELNQEREQLLAAMGDVHDGDDGEQRQLQQRLLDQLQRRIGQLQELQQQKQAALKT